MSKKNIAKIVILAISCTIVGVLLGGVIVQNRAQNYEAATRRRYNLLSKRILIEDPNDIILDFKALKTDVNQYIDTKIGKENISFYFEYLPTGYSIGTNEDKEVIGASLLKLPVVINVYKAAEEGKLDFDEKVALKQEWLNDGYGQLYKKGVGYELTIRQAAKLALIESDNTAIMLLFSKLAELENTKSPRILDFVDVNYDTNSKEQILIGAQSYSSILKCLYFACYLSKESSQEILYNLTQSESKDRLPLHIPNEVPIAHKIGTYDQAAESDCGIVYVEKRNYILCVMVQGSDENAINHIANLSKLVYESISASKSPRAL